MSLLTIDNVACKKCGKCAKVCPVGIISTEEINHLPYVDVPKEELCILCGHCEVICAERALTNNSLRSDEEIPSEVEEINQTNLSAYFRNRRSIRTYLPKPVDKALLEQVIDVVRYAPTASNRQLNQWIIVHDTAKVEKITEETINWMQTVRKENPEVAKRLNMPGLIASYKKGFDKISRNAPHLIIGYGDANYAMGMKDSIIAATQLELLLPAFGLGGCWAGYLMVAFQQSAALKKIIGLDENQTVHSVLMAGYPKYRYYQVPERQKAIVNWV